MRKASKHCTDTPVAHARKTQTRNKNTDPRPLPLPLPASRKQTPETFYKRLGASVLVRRGRRRGRGGLLRHLEQTVIISPAALQPRRNGWAYRLAANKPLPPGSDLTQKGYFWRLSSRLHLFLSFAFLSLLLHLFARIYTHTRTRTHRHQKTHEAPAPDSCRFS